MASINSYIGYIFTALTAALAGASPQLIALVRERNARARLRAAQAQTWSAQTAEAFYARLIERDERRDRVIEECKRDRDEMRVLIGDLQS